MGQITVEKDMNGISGLCIITPAIHGDSRGYFMETYHQRDMAEAGLNYAFVQDNQSASSKGVLRGLHYQKQYPQTKLVRVIRGEVLMWQWIFGRILLPSESTAGFCFLKKTGSSF